MKFIGLLIGLLLVVAVVSAGLFGPDPTVEPVNNDTWIPVDKCWVYQPDTWEPLYSMSDFHSGEIKYFVTYVNQNGHHKIDRVDIDTWYSVTSARAMYFQGGR